MGLKRAAVSCACALLGTWCAAARDPLEAAVAHPVLPAALAGSSELLAMSALAEADIAADEAWRKVKTPEEMSALMSTLSRSSGRCARKKSALSSPARTRFSAKRSM